MHKIFLTFAALCAVALFGNTASAALISPGNNPQADEENILFNNGDTGTTIIGVTNTTGTEVSFSSTTTLIADASGQAKIASEDGGGFTDMTVALVSGDTFGDLIINLNVANFDGGQQETGTVTFTTFEANGLAQGTTETFDISSAGQNFFTLISDLGGFLSISFETSMDVTLETVIQPRISGLGGGTVVPEASSLVAWGICAVFGAFVTYRRRRA